ncbi:4Fe-4S dicluster-binding protein [Thermogymnomonas acidicola]|uniref:4Fe-4S dicluster-binding protein n=1 Tax=Thermogymnomonas acidicola TaxID=399579 RepID=UPI001665958E|nr:4Fe-4S dicluster-binding protein [Thermogymnomonas acidicola]
MDRGPVVSLEQARMKRIEIHYRGIFQKTLAKRIGGDLVKIAVSQGKVAFSNGRYSDSPERDGIPAKYFVYMSDELSEEDLEAVCGAKLEADKVDISIVLDDTMIKGVEPWAWYGIRPVNDRLVANAVQVFVSNRTFDDILSHLEKKDFAYRIGILPGEASFSGLWYYRDDGTDVRVLGAVARADPDAVDIDHVLEYVEKKYGKEKAAMAKKAYEELRLRDVRPGEGIVWPYQKPVLPKWTEFQEGVVVEGVKGQFRKGPRGTPRNPHFKRGTSKTQRPVIRFDLCTKCTLCWYECPDEVFDVTPEGYYDPHYEYCTGCGRCAEACPVEECIVMVDENRFDSYDSPWEMYRKDPKGYIEWVESKKGDERVVPSYVTGMGMRVEKGKKVPAKVR